MQKLGLVRQVFLGPLPRVLFVLAAAATSALASADGGPSARASYAAAYADRPISFEEYRGETSPITVVARGLGYGLVLNATESALFLASSPRDSYPCGNGVIIRMTGANPSARFSGRDELPGKSRYLVGSRSSWRTDVRQYRRIEYENVYPRIDLAYYGSEGSLEYDFVVRPGGDPRRIRFEIDGADGIRLDGDGNLVLSVRGQEVVHRAPVVYQRTDGQRKNVAGRFVLRGQREVGFDVGPYAADQPLVLDPVLAYSSFLGGGSRDSGAGIAADAYGNVYVTGGTCSLDFPTKNPVQPSHAGTYQDFDVFVTKINASGALVYSTYLGGGNGDSATAIAVDPSGNAYVTGSTSSSDFPTLNALQSTKKGSSDGFVAKLDPSGGLVYSTYLGGSQGDDPFGGIFGGPGTGVSDIAVDAAGDAYIVGSTNATDFPTVHPIQGAKALYGDAFVAKINPSGSALVYSTYLGGNGSDGASGIALDAAGSAYVVGTTDSTNFPTVNPIQPSFAALTNYDTFLAKLNPSGSALVYSTCLGGHLSDFGSAVAVDAAGNAYVAGNTASTDFPTVNPLQAMHGGGFFDAFIAKVDAAGSSLVYSTYLGGNGLDYGNAIVVDGSGNAFVTGSTVSADFPSVNPIQPWSGGVFLSELDPTGGALVYSTRIGDSGGSGNALARDHTGNIYLTGEVNSNNFPIVNAFQPVFGGPDPDAIVVRIGPLPAGDFTGNLHADLVWRNRSTGSSVVWFMDGSTLAGGALLDPILDDPRGRIVATPDLNGDGWPDIVWRSAKGVNVAWFMNGTTLTGAALLPAADPKWDIRAAVDLDADGQPDLVLRNETTGEVQAWLMNGTALKAVAPLPFVPDIDWQCYGGGDFNGDGKADLLWRNGSTGQITVWLMDGTTMVDGAWLPTIEDARWKIVAVADYNGDGRPDIVWHHETSGDTIVWFMNGLVVFGGAVLPQVLDTDWTIVGPR